MHEKPLVWYYSLASTSRSRKNLYVGMLSLLGLTERLWIRLIEKCVFLCFFLLLQQRFCHLYFHSLLRLVYFHVSCFACLVAFSSCCMIFRSNRVLMYSRNPRGIAC
jgi:hypothetical protein